MARMARMSHANEGSRIAQAAARVAAKPGVLPRMVPMVAVTMGIAAGAVEGRGESLIRRMRTYLVHCRKVFLPDHR